MVGTLLQPDSKTPVLGASISNIRSQKVAVSDEKGRFLMQLAAGDSLLVHALGYKTFLYLHPAEAARQKEIAITLTADAVLLKEVEVFALPSLRDLKTKGFNLPDNVRSPNYVPAPEPVQQLPSPSVGGPIDALYNMLSNEGKQLRQLKAFEQRQAAEQERKEQEDYNKYFKDNKGYQ